MRSIEQIQNEGREPTNAVQVRADGNLDRLSLIQDEDHVCLSPGQAKSIYPLLRKFIKGEPIDSQRFAND